MKLQLSAIGFAFGLAFAGAASAEPYVDYTPQKGAWEIQTYKIDPNHIDDYLTGLKKEYVPVLEILKRHGIIDQYIVMQKLNGQGGGENIMVIQHYPNLSVLDPDKTRDQQIEKEIYAVVSKQDADKAEVEFNKYRQFAADDYWTVVDFPH